VDQAETGGHYGTAATAISQPLPAAARAAPAVTPAVAAASATPSVTPAVGESSTSPESGGVGLGIDPLLLETLLLVMIWLTRLWCSE